MISWGAELLARRREPWSWEAHQEKVAEEAERLNVRRWPPASLLRAELVRAVHEAAREGGGHARLEQAIRRLA